MRPRARVILTRVEKFRAGIEFEIRIRQNEQDNPKFNFLNFDDPYHAYYQHKVREFREGKNEEEGPKPVVQKVRFSTSRDLTKLVTFLPGVEIGSTKSRRRISRSEKSATGMGIHGRSSVNFRL